MIEVYLSANELQISRDEYSQSTKIIDSEYNQVSANLHDVVNASENLHIKKQHQLQILLQKYEHIFDGTLGEFNMEYCTNYYPY
jgi:hypothetical protein